MFTYNTDIDLKIIQLLDDKDIFYIGQVNKYFQKSLLSKSISEPRICSKKHLCTTSALLILMSKVSQRPEVLNTYMYSKAFKILGF